MDRGVRFEDIHIGELGSRRFSHPLTVTAVRGGAVEPGHIPAVTDILRDHVGVPLESASRENHRFRGVARDAFRGLADDTGDAAAGRDQFSRPGAGSHRDAKRLRFRLQRRDQHLTETDAFLNIEEELLSLLPGPADTE